MHLKVTRYKYKGKWYRHAKIVESYREGTRVKHRTLKNIGRIESDEDLERAKKLLDSLRRGEVLTKLSDVDFESVLEYGLIYVGQKLWNKFGLKKVTENLVTERRIGFDFSSILLLLAVNRFYRPSSDRDAYEWMKNEAFHDVYVEPQYVYRTLDLVAEEKERVEKGFFRELVGKGELRVDVVFYDLTSTYFHSNNSNLAERGYSRDHRPDLKQVVIGVVMCNGLPIAHEVWPGNTADKATLKRAVVDLKRRFRIDRAIFVGDRGVFAVKALDELEKNDFDYIIATKRRRNKFVEELLTKPIEGEAKTVGVDGRRRYILCLDEDTRRQKVEELDRDKKEAEKKLKTIAKTLEGKKKRKDLLDKLVKKSLKSIAKFFEWKLMDGEFTYSLKKEVWDYENKIAGRLLLVTTSHLPPEEVLKSYKDLKDVEQFFDDLKHLVYVRPVYHTADRRIRGHIFVCILSLLLKQLMDRRLGTKGSEAINEFKRIKVIRCRVEGEETFVSTKTTEVQRAMFQKLGIEESRGLM